MPVVTDRGVDVVPSGRQAGYGKDRQSFRLDPDKWEAFGVAVAELGYKDRSAYLRDVIDWVLHKPGVKTPKRPPATPDA